MTEHSTEEFLKLLEATGNIRLSELAPNSVLSWTTDLVRIKDVRSRNRKPQSAANGGAEMALPP